MAQRESGYARQALDAYWTPAWVFSAIKAVEVFHHPVDIAPRDNDGYDFLADTTKINEILTNPPFSLAEQFIRHGLTICCKKMAFLLPVTFDAAHTRRDLFENRPFKAKYTLTKRIRWDNLEQKKNGPSTNHAWFVWDFDYAGRSFMGWLP